MMKNFSIYLLMISVLFGSGCEDFLTTEPLTTVTDGNFYQTPEDANTALVGCYDGLQRVWEGGIGFPLASEVFSDNCFGGTGNGDQYEYRVIDEFDISVGPSLQNLFSANWESYYRAIYRCNVFLNKFDQINWGEDDELRETYEAETRFIRAYMYFDMVRLWGNIPLLTEPTIENVPQADPDDVYELIAQDLVFAAENLDSEPYTSQDPATYGRVTKWAAEALLARVYLYYTGYYGQPDLVGIVDQNQALAYLEDVITNGGFSLIENFADLWPAASPDNYVGEDNRETVFAIKYTFTSDYDGNTDGNHWVAMYGIREQSIYPYGNGWGGGTVNPKLWNDFSDDDARKVASITSIVDEGLDFENADRQREYTGYYVKKYSPMSDEEGNSVAVNKGATNFFIGQFQDYVAIRYSDVLLMAAELGSPNAQDYFDQVRQRAYGDSFTSIPVNAENIMQERYFEFAFEGIRYWDLLRQGVQTAADIISQSITVQDGNQPYEKNISAQKIIETQGLQQIPNTQITLSSGTLKQNDGW